MKKDNVLNTIGRNREARTKLTVLRDTYFTPEKIKSDLEEVGAVVRLQFYKILLDFTIPKPMAITEDGINYSGIEFTPNKEQTKRKIYTYDHILDEAKKIEFNGNGKTG